MKYAPLFLVLLVLTVGFIAKLPAASAHQTVTVGDIVIEAGWTTEPSLINQLNEIVVTITKNSTGQPITNAMAQVDSVVKKGTATKPLDFTPGEEAGSYVAQILPSQVGQLSIVLQGTIAGQNIPATEIPLEDVQDTKTIQFPPGTDTGPVSDAIVKQLQGVISDLTAQVEQSTAASQQAVQSANDATKAASDLKSSADRAYVFGMVGVGVGVAGIIIGVTALTRGREKLKV